MHQAPKSGQAAYIESIVPSSVLFNGKICIDRCNEENIRALILVSLTWGTESYANGNLAETVLPAPKGISNPVRSADLISASGQGYCTVERIGSICDCSYCSTRSHLLMISQHVLKVPILRRPRQSTSEPASPISSGNCSRGGTRFTLLNAEKQQAHIQS